MYNYIKTRGPFLIPCISQCMLQLNVCGHLYCLFFELRLLGIHFRKLKYNNFESMAPPSGRNNKPNSLKPKTPMSLYLSV